MRNDSKKWQAPGIITEQGFAFAGGQLKPVPLKHLTTISGTLSQTLSASKCDAAFGWPDIILADRYAVHLRRDRIMVINAPELDDGWDPDRAIAITDASYGFCTFDLIGPRALELLQCCGEIDLNEISTGVSRLMNGLMVMLYRYGSQDCFRMHISLPNREAFLEILSRKSQNWT